MNVTGPERIAVSHFILLNKMLKDIEDKYRDHRGKDNENKIVVGGPIKSRLRESGSLILSGGIPGFIAYYASKSVKDGGKDGLLGQLLKAFKHASSIEGAKEAKEILEKVGLAKSVARENLELFREVTEEGKGYTIVLAMVLAYMQSLSIIDCQEENAIDCVAKTINDMLGEAGREAMATELLNPYLTMLKRLVEAVVKDNS